MHLGGAASYLGVSSVLTTDDSDVSARLVSWALLGPSTRCTSTTSVVGALLRVLGRTSGASGILLPCRPAAEPDWLN
jgi:hypothetical protein